MKELRTWKKVFESDLDYIVNELLDVLDTPSVVILNGPVGAGKTTLTKCFVGIALSREDEQSENEISESFDTQSPSYSLINEIGDIVHADLYRIKDPEEIVHLELPLYVEDKEYVLIEWGKSAYRVCKKRMW